MDHPTLSLLLQLPAANPAPAQDAGATGGTTTAPGDAAATSGSPLGMFSPLLLMGALFLFMWFMVIRPERKRQKERAALLSALKKGDQVVTTAGLYGQVAALDERTVTLKVADDLRLKFERNAIAQILSPKDEDSESDKEPAKGKLVAAGK